MQKTNTYKWGNSFRAHIEIYYDQDVAIKSFGSEVKASAWSVGDWGSIPEFGRSPGEGNDNPLQYSCLENPMEGGAW